VSKEYPDIETEHWIVDIGAAKLADTPEVFDVIVMPNLYGDILSDVAAQIAGSVGLAGSANIGITSAMFEAIHGSAPRRAGQNLANPSGLLHGALMMLVHIGQSDVAERIHNSWSRTIEDGIHTYDIYSDDMSKQKVGTKEFAQAVVQRLGKAPEKLKAVKYSASASQMKPIEVRPTVPANKEIVGVDLFCGLPNRRPGDVGKIMQQISGEGVKIKAVSNRGVKVWPGGFDETNVVDVWRCRFFADPEGGTVTHQQIVSLLSRCIAADGNFVKMELLYRFDGKPVYSAIQGE
jgi:isocitrate dehydrogenase